MTFLFFLDEKIDQDINLLAGHIALVLEVDQANGFRCHGRIHDSDLRHIQQRGSASVLLVKQFAPTLQFAISLFGVVAESVCVVPGWNGRDPTGRSIHQITALVQP